MTNGTVTEIIERSLYVNGQIFRGPESHITYLLQRYLPVAELEDESLSCFSRPDQQFLTVDITPEAPHCGIYVDGEEESGDLSILIEPAHYGAVRVVERRAVEFCMPDPREVDDVLDESEYEMEDEHPISCGMYWRDVVPRGTDLKCNCHIGDRKAAKRKEARQILSDEPCPLWAGVLEPTDSEYLLTEVMGATVNGFTHPVQTLLSTGLGDARDVFDPALSHDSLYIVPVSAGYNRGARRYGWFGQKFKSLRTAKPADDFMTQPFGSVISEARSHIQGSIGAHALSTHALRPLAKAHVALGNRVVIADAWPVTRFVSFAVATPDSLGSNVVVRKFFNWAHGNLGTLIPAKMSLSAAMLKLIISAPEKKGRNHVRHVDFLFKGCPEPSVSMTDQQLSKLLDIVERRTMEEKPTLIVLEGSI